METKIKSVLIETHMNILDNIRRMFDLKEYLYPYMDINSTNAKALKNNLADTYEYYNQFKGMMVHDVLLRLFTGATQQFCFWYIKSKQEARTNYTSSSINKIIRGSGSHDEMFRQLKNHIIKDSVTLRKDRLEIFDKARDRAQILLYIDDIYNFDDMICSMYEFEPFKYDLFRKKANFFIMDVIRYAKVVEEDLDYFNDLNPYEGFDPSHYRNEFLKFVNHSLKPFCMPAVDYQIPKALRSLKIISYPDIIDRRINSGIEFGPDSTEELLLRSIVYVALERLRVKFSKVTGITHEELDSNLFFNRDSFKDTRFHLCYTTSY